MIEEGSIMAIEDDALLDVLWFKSLASPEYFSPDKVDLRDLDSAELSAEKYGCVGASSTGACASSVPLATIQRSAPEDGAPVRVGLW
jgi:hypothetical protein